MQQLNYVSSLPLAATTPIAANDADAVVNVARNFFISGQYVYTGWLKFLLNLKPVSKDLSDVFCFFFNSI